MNELKGKCVNVVLGIQEGKGMDFLKQPIYIVANFNGRIMESDPCDPTANPCFNTELVWESEKRDVRKVRSINTPLRVEVCTKDSLLKRECIGFTLLSLRSAPVIVSMDFDIPYKWYKLLGVPSEFKTFRPEMLLSLTLRDHMTNRDLPPAISFVHNSDNIEQDEKEIIPVRFIQDGFIQIGNDSDVNEIFQLSIVIKQVANLDLLLPENLVFNQRKDKYYLSFKIFGLQIKSKPFYNDLQEKIILNEKIVVRMQSNFEILKLFFTKFYDVETIFNCGPQNLGSTNINLKNLIPDVSENDFRNFYNGSLIFDETCIFSSSTDIMLNNSTDRKPCVDVQLALDWRQQFGIPEVGSGESEAAPRIITSKLKPKETGAGDLVVDVVKEEVKVIRTIDSETYKNIPNTRGNSKFDDNVDDFQFFNVIIILENLILEKTLKETNFSVYFYHPQANSVLILNTEIENFLGRKQILDNSKCKLYYVTTEDNIENMLKAWGPRIRFSTMQNKNIFEDIIFETGNIVMNGNKFEKTYATNLKQLNGEVAAKINITIFIEEQSTQPLSSDFDLLPYILDEKIAMNEIEDFNKWKDAQKENYFRKLKQTEKDHIIEIKNEWCSRKSKLEEQLLNSLTRCKTLSKELQKQAGTLKIQKAVEEKQKEMIKEENYNFQDELYKNILKYGHLESKDLIQRLTEIKEENECLQEIINDQQTEIQKFKKTTLTNEQTANLLQQLRTLEEKFEELQKSKSYFKEQWKKAVREIHELKAEGQKCMQNQLQNHKEELSHLSLDSFLSMKTKAQEENEKKKNNFSGFCTKKSCSEFNININKSDT